MINDINFRIIEKFIEYFNNNLITLFLFIISIFSFYYNFMRGSDIICIPKINTIIRRKIDESSERLEIVGDCVFINKGNRTGIVNDLAIFPAFNNYNKLIEVRPSYSQNEKSKLFKVGVIKHNIFERIIRWKRNNVTESYSGKETFFRFPRYKTAAYTAYIPYSFEYYSELKVSSGMVINSPLTIADKESIPTSFVFRVDLDYVKYKQYKNKIFITGLIIYYNSVRKSKITPQTVHYNLGIDFDKDYIKID